MGNCLGTPQEGGAAAAAAARPATPGVMAPSAPGSKPGTAGSAVHVQAGGGGAQVAPAPPPAGPPRPDAAKIHQMRKRIAVAAEAISSAADIEIPVIPKTEYAERLIGAAGAGREEGEGAGGPGLPGGGHGAAGLRRQVLPCQAGLPGRAKPRAAAAGSARANPRTYRLPPCPLLCSQGNRGLPAV